MEIETSTEQLKNANDRLIEMASELRSKWEKVDSLRLPLPKLLFHASPKANRNRIRNQGINPNELMFEQRAVVCLSDDEDFAIEVVCMKHKIRPEEVDLWLVDTAGMRREDKNSEEGLIENYLTKADPGNENPIYRQPCHEVWFRGKIEPEWIDLDPR